MARPEKTLDVQAGPLAIFAADLRSLRRGIRGLTYRAMAQHVNYSASVLSEAAAGRKLPTLAVTLAYVRACGGDCAEWSARWHALSRELAEDAVPPGDAACPYQGLASFQPEDADRFFGREQLTAELASRLTEQRFLALFGVRGGGTSSILRAGLIPAVRSGVVPDGREWRVVVLTPGPHPMGELAACLGIPAPARNAAAEAERLLLGAPVERPVLLVIDQFEEIFTLCHDDAERARFVDVTLAGARRPDGRVRVVLGARAEEYPRCARYPRLVAALRDAQLLAGPMSQDELRSAIVEPARGAGCTIEPALLATLLLDGSTGPGALARLSHALLETWHRRRGSTLTVDAYRAAGGMRDAIEHTAERMHQGLTDRERDIARRLLVRLTASGDDAAPPRRITRRELEELGDPGTTGRVVLDRLAQARFVTTHGDTVELSHPDLPAAWPRLRRWIAGQPPAAAPEQPGAPAPPVRRGVIAGLGAALAASLAAVLVLIVMVVRPGIVLPEDGSTEHSDAPAGTPVTGTPPPGSPCSQLPGGQACFDRPRFWVKDTPPGDGHHPAAIWTSTDGAVRGECHNYLNSKGPWVTCDFPEAVREHTRVGFRLTIMESEKVLEWGPYIPAPGS